MLFLDAVYMMLFTLAVFFPVLGGFGVLWFRGRFKSAVSRNITVALAMLVGLLLQIFTQTMLSGVVDYSANEFYAWMLAIGEIVVVFSLVWILIASSSINDNKVQS